MDWKDWPYWLKGGVIAAGINLLLLLLYYIFPTPVFSFKKSYNQITSILGLPAFVVIGILPFSIFSIFWIIVVSTILFFIIGAIIGLIVGKVKSRK